MPIHSATESKKMPGDLQAKVISMLVDAYPEGMQKKDRDGNLALHSAIERGDVIGVHVIKKIVDVFPKACGAKDKDGTCICCNPSLCMYENALFLICFFAFSSLSLLRSFFSSLRFTKATRHFTAQLNVVTKTCLQLSNFY